MNSAFAVGCSGKAFAICIPPGLHPKAWAIGLTCLYAIVMITTVSFLVKKHCKSGCRRQDTTDGEGYGAMAGRPVMNQAISQA